PCHGQAGGKEKVNAVLQNEYLTWSQKDEHRKAYSVLREDRARKMAMAYGLTVPPESAQVCLNCHADSVPKNRQGPLFRMEDGVACEACHGGASSWLGPHVSGATHQENVVAGLYPTERPVARALKCLSCHYGDETRIADYRLYGAGHPRLRFELATFT